MALRLSNINKKNPEKVVKILNALKVLFGTLSTGAVMLGQPYISFGILAAGGVIDFCISVFYDGQDKTDKR